MLSNDRGVIHRRLFWGATAVLLLVGLVVGGAVSMKNETNAMPPAQTQETRKKRMIASSCRKTAGVA